MKRPKVSVVIPVYGVSRYIERCARCLFEQTLDEIEYIFVDDCTPDNSIEILNKVLEDYPQRKQQVQILHHEVNKGLPASRKSGYDAAHGDYIAHCDSDDWVDKDMYLLLYDAIEEKQADIAVCDYYRSNDEYRIYKDGIKSEKKEEFFHDLLSHKVAWGVWNRLIRMSLYQDVIFPKDNQAEDMALMMQLVSKAKSVCAVKKPLYYYFDNPQSMCKTYTKESLLRSFFQVCENVKLVDRCFDQTQISKEYKNNLIFIKLQARNRLIPFISDIDVLHQWKTAFPEMNSKVLFSKYVPIDEKIKFYLVYLGIYSRVKYIKDKIKIIAQSIA